MAHYPQTQVLVRGADKNFPVASCLLPKAARSAILHFYIFARNADNIADSAVLSAAEKTTLLTQLQQAVQDGDSASAPLWAKAYIEDTLAQKSNRQHGVDLLTAFLQDASKNRYHSYAELLEYCRYSAVPVGRVVLECCGESTANTQAADALCTVLQLINHMQDCKDDYQQLNRIYLPQEWMQECGVEEPDLGENRSNPALRALFNHYLEECRMLLATAAPLPKTVRSWRLRLELRLILELARALVDKLFCEDSLQKPIKIAHWQWPFYLLRSVCRL